MLDISTYKDFLLLREKALDALAQQVAEAETRGTTLSCVILDMDHLYALEETYGDSAMESLLEQVLSLLKQSETDSCSVDTFAETSSLPFWGTRRWNKRCFSLISFGGSSPQPNSS